MERPCLRCSVQIDYEKPCPECGWDFTEFRSRGRFGLARKGHGEPESDGEGGRGPSGTGLR